MSSPVVHLTDVTFRWPRAPRPVLDIPALDVAPGERLFIHGPSGSGKSTLLNLLAGVSVPEGGAVEILGTDLAALSNAGRDAFRADHVGLIFQMFNLVPYLSLTANVLLPCRFSVRRRQRAEAGGSMAAQAARLMAEMGLDTAELENRPVAELSVGQQQRVAAARALIGQPELVIADEPTSALDADTQDSFLELLLAETHGLGAALVFVSHDRRLAARFERVIAIDEINRAGEASGGAS